MKNRLLIYGATGFSGRLIAKEALRCWAKEDAAVNDPRPSRQKQAGRAWKRRPVLAGRDAAELQALGEELNLPWVAVALDDVAGLDRALRDVAVVLNAAGPYQTTAVPMLKACLRNRTHYLDICGAFEVLRRLDNYNADAVELGVLVMPAVGFTVVASDYLVAQLKRAMPDLHYLRIALSRVDFISRGSLKSLQAAAREGVSIRRNGKFTSVPVGQLERAFTFRQDEGNSICTAIRLADLITAPLTTRSKPGDRGVPNGDRGVPNIETYIEAPLLHRLAYQAASAFALPMQLWPIKQLINAELSFWPAGPSDADRESARQVVVVEGEDRYRSRLTTGYLETSDVYDFTAESAVAIAEFVLRDEPKEYGFQSPAGLYFDELGAMMRKYTRQGLPEALTGVH